MEWRTFWNEDHAIYVNARHRARHAVLVSRGIVALLPPGMPRVLDWGCGEAEGAPFVAARCGALHLYDSAPRVRENLRARYDGDSRISVLDEAAVRDLPEGSLDVVVIVSVVQYLTRDALRAVLALLAPKLGKGGRLIVADVIPPDLSPLGDARALLAFAWRDGFFAAAVIGLARTFFSDYRRFRAALGLTRWSEADMLKLLEEHGYRARREPANIGHNAARMTFMGERKA